MTGARFRMVAWTAAVAVVGAVAVSGAGVLGADRSETVSDLAQLIGAAAAVGLFTWTGLRAGGRERRWRLLVAGAMAAWLVGQAFWTWYRLVLDQPIPSPSPSDIGYLGMPVLMLPALLVFAADTRREDRPEGGHRAGDRGGDGAGRSPTVLVLDGLIVVGSLLLLTWASSLGAVVHAGAPTSLAFAVAIAYPVTDVVLVVIVALLAAFRRVRLRPQLLLLGLGLLAIALSDSFFVYLVSSGAERIHPLFDAGFVAGPVLVGLAAVAPATALGGARALHRASTWTHLLMPYLPLLATGLLMAGKTALGYDVDGFEIYLGLLVGALVVVRQLLTLVENMSLLERVGQSRQQLAHQAFHDPLTGLANRVLFAERLTHAVALHDRGERPVGLVYVDLDDFKTVNDSLGHAAGDALLRSVADRLRRCVRSGDTVARLGGDEFAVVLGDGGPSGDESPDQVAQRILAALREPYPLPGHARVLSASIGVVAPDGGEPAPSAEQLLHRADAAMYAAKRHGKATCVVYRAGLSPTPHDPDLPERLAAALRGLAGRVDVHYQPIVRLRDGTVIGVEALARWHDPDRGPVPADVFVAVAERTGLVAELDDQVLDRACADLAGIFRDSGLLLSVHVNVSATRLAGPGLEASVLDALRRHQLPGSALVLEITETSSVTDIGAANALLQRLRHVGVRLALDDFGTGYGTLAHLHLLPVDVVKLDATLTRTDPAVARSEVLRRSVVSISRALGMLVVAEGIETADQAGDLLTLGCDLGQGYLYGEAMPVDRLVQALPPRPSARQLDLDWFSVPPAPAPRSSPSTRSHAG